MTALATRGQGFAAILTERRGEDLPALHAFVHGLDKDHNAVVSSDLPR
jgi:hypothetical protein